MVSGGRQLLVAVSVLLYQLVADLLGAQTRIEPRGAEGGIGLTLGINDSFDILKQVGQMIFSTLSTSLRKCIDTFMGSFSYRGSIPPELLFGFSLSTVTEFFDGFSHKDSPLAAMQLLRSLNEKCGNGWGQFPLDSPPECNDYKRRVKSICRNAKRVSDWTDI